MKKLLIILLLSCNIGVSQQNERVSKRIILTEEFTIENYKKPNSILFYSGGHWEIEKYYNILFKKLKKEFKYSSVHVDFKFDEVADIPVRLYSFDQLKINFNENDYDAICVFALGDIESNAERIKKKTGQTIFINLERILYYDFYMILVELKSNKILMKRKYSIEAMEKYYSQNKKIAKVVSKEIEQ